MHLTRRHRPNRPTSRGIDSVQCVIGGRRKPTTQNETSGDAESKQGLETTKVGDVLHDLVARLNGLRVQLERPLGGDQID